MNIIEILDVRISDNEDVVEYEEEEEQNEQEQDEEITNLWN